MRTSAHRLSGFTLVELMVSLALLGLVSVYLTDMLIRQSRTYTVVDHVTEMQQNVRAIADLLERDARGTGFLVPEAAAVCGLDLTGFGDVLFVTDADSLSFDDDSVVDYDLGAQVLGGFAGTGNSENLVLSSLVLDARAFYDTDDPQDGVADSDFRAGAGVIVVDRANPARGSSCGLIPAGPPSPFGASTISGVDFTLGGGAAGRPLAAIPAGGAAEDLVAIPAHVYGLNLNRQLIRDLRVIAEDVEDLQVAYFIDLDDDDVLDLPQEYPGATAAWTYNPSGAPHDKLKEIRINFVVRSRLPDPEFQRSGAGQFQAAENRIAPAGTDGFRRRLFTTTVRPRNVGERSIGS